YSVPPSSRWLLTVSKCRLLSDSGTRPADAPAAAGALASGVLAQPASTISMAATPFRVSEVFTGGEDKPRRAGRGMKNPRRNSHLTPATLQGKFNVLSNPGW